MSHFTRRQAQIVKLISDGLVDKQIAVVLGISVPTVRTQLQRLYRELGCHNRAGAVAKWIAGGAIVP
ncbi:MAG TPA: helix-turn-helix transcriptional regulator [Candidatus Limnocylindrales bacterium]|nr:helix-turn-helix transcriptional regulator [Candidatus Limnocylindrales bacterium]